MSLIDRFLTSFRTNDRGVDEPPGLAQLDDKTVVYIKPDGSRIEIGSGGSQPLHTASVVLTDAQIKALPSTPVVIAADPGAGKLAIPQTFFLRMNPVGYVNYANIDPTCQVFLGNLAPVFNEASPESAVSGLLADAGFGDAVASTEQQILVNAPAVNGLTRPNLGWADTDLSGATTIHCQNGGAGNFTGGDAGNTLQIAFAYFVFDTTTGAFVTA